LLDELRQRHGWAICSYVIMPGHVHFFCAPDPDCKSLSDFMREWKSWASRRINGLPPRPTTAATTLWQREFFDHILRSNESYAQKWIMFGIIR
jgi:REP element-mobilizing transposase RayT